MIAGAAGTGHFLVNVAVPLVLVALGFVAGRIIERRHFRSLSLREARGGPVLTNLKNLPEGRTLVSSRFCIGSVVIASDYFKFFGAKLKTLVGGRLRTLETMMERGRREALLRLRDQAARTGADVVLAVRLETSMIMRSERGGTYPAAEVIAYVTAVKTAAAAEADG